MRYKIHQNKTGKLLTVSTLIPSCFCEDKYFVELKNFGEKLGLLFQITDDIEEIANAKHLVLPSLVLFTISLSGLQRQMRANMLEVLDSDYVKFARAKGLSEKPVIYKHAFRNTMIPLVTMLAGILPSLFGGMMITEQVFGIDGIGRLAYQALRDGDIPFVMGYNMFLAILTIIGTLFSDIMYSVVDPRVTLGK